MMLFRAMLLRRSNLPPIISSGEASGVLDSSTAPKPEEVWCRCTIAVHLIAPKFALKQNEADGSGQGANVKSSYTSKTLTWRFKGVRNKGAELMLAYLGHFQIDMLILISGLGPCSIPTSATEGVVCLTDCQIHLHVFAGDSATCIEVHTVGLQSDVQIRL